MIPLEVMKTAMIFTSMYVAVNESSIKISYLFHL